MRKRRPGDAAGITRLLETSPDVVRHKATAGANRAEAGTYWIAEISHYIYAGDTALHIAAAAYRSKIAEELVARGADVGAKNRRGAEPLHYAADGVPGSQEWNPEAQAETIRCLIAAGANPNAVDNSGVAPLHRAVRTRCAAAVKALLDGGADAHARNKSGSTPLLLASLQTGRGGSGSVEAKAQQAEILKILKRFTA